MAEGRGRFGTRFWALAGLLVLLLYVAWLGAPYLRSVVVRDAAVTTWLDVTSAPIAGFIGKDPLHPGDTVGKDGRIAIIEDDTVDRTPVLRAEADVARAEQRVRGLQELMPKLASDPIAQARTSLELADAKIEAETAGKILAGVKSNYENARRRTVNAPPDAYVWSLITSPGNFVEPGTKIASWIDCSIMLVDVPVSDVELALLQTDAPARVVIEGDRRVREGKVYLTRGAAATIGADDLAAIAKGRTPGTGQVLVQLTPSPEDIEACPIGAAAYVDFPDIGTIDILRARLRL